MTLLSHADERLQTTRNLSSSDPGLAASVGDEFYVRDCRVDVSPVELVYSKMLNVMPKSCVLPVSCNHVFRDVRR
jgi:hypothetical protein